MEVYEAAVRGLCRVAKGWELFHHVAVDHRAQGRCHLAAERTGVERGELPFDCLADLTLGSVLRRVECLDLEFTFSAGGRNIEPEFLSKTVGTWNFTDTAMLIPFTIDFHPATLSGAEDVASVATMVLRGATALVLCNQVE